MAQKDDDFLAENTEKFVPRAYHGTTRKAAKAILLKGFQISNHEWLYLGDGVYFFEDCYVSARRWANGKCEFQGGRPAVIRCSVALGRCIDLTVQSIAEPMKAFIEAIVARLNRAKAEQLDGACVNQAAILNMFAVEHKADSLRAPYIKGPPLGEGLPERLNLHLDSQIYLCVRSLHCITNLALDVREVTS